MNKGVVWIVVLLLVVIGALLISFNSDGGDDSGDSNVEESQEIFGVLEDVSDSGATGTARAEYENGVYSLRAEFGSLEDPEGTDFYEGWVVRRGVSFSVISTGKVDKIDGVYVNEYTSDENLLDHDFYVLTIEPDDGDPAPADHVIEGVMA